MRNLTVLLIFCVFIIIAMVIGAKKATLPDEATKEKPTTVSGIPHIGRIEVLNGCGEPKAASVIAGYLRNKNFDVKEIGNADSWNYSVTMVVSRTEEPEVANKVCKALNTDKCITMRTQEKNYDVSVIVGADYQDLIK